MFFNICEEKVKVSICGRGGGEKYRKLETEIYNLMMIITPVYRCFSFRKQFWRKYNSLLCQIPSKGGREKEPEEFPKSFCAQKAVLPLFLAVKSRNRLKLLFFFPPSNFFRNTKLFWK